MKLFACSAGVRSERASGLLEAQVHAACHSPARVKGLEIALRAMRHRQIGIGLERVVQKRQSPTADAQILADGAVEMPDGIRSGGSNLHPMLVGLRH